MSLRASATLRACSGAMYCGEPRNVPLWVISGLSRLALGRSAMDFTRPKSSTFTRS